MSLSGTGSYAKVNELMIISEDPKVLKKIKNKTCHGDIFPVVRISHI